MAVTRREQIRKKALELIASQPAGIRYSQLTALIHEAMPEIPVNTIHGNIWNLDAVFPNKVAKPARGVFQAIEFREEEAQPEPAIAVEQAEEAKVGEEQFYEPFADWLKNELEE